VKSGGLFLAGVTLDLPNGKFSVDPPPTGEVTADVVFSVENSVPSIIAALLYRAGVAFDGVNFSAWHTQ